MLLVLRCLHETLRICRLLASAAGPYANTLAKPWRHECNLLIRDGTRTVHDLDDLDVVGRCLFIEPRALRLLRQFKNWLYCHVVFRCFNQCLA